jgi:predicted nucleic acid-binding Zn ribbon protein
MTVALPTRACVICGKAFRPWRANHRYCGRSCRELVYNPRRLAKHLRRVYGELADRGLVPEGIRALISSG